MPDSRGSLAKAVAGVPDDEVRRMLGLNAIDFYRFDRPTVEAAAAQVGPRGDEIITPV